MTQSANARPVESKDSPQLTEFGRTLYSLMLTRGIEHRQTLLRELNSPPDEPRYSISQARLTYYLNGDRTVDPMFLECVSELLSLNKSERRQLGMAFAYGQIKRTPDEIAKIERYSNFF